MLFPYKPTHHKYRVDTVTRYHDGSTRRSHYFAASVAQIVHGLENRPNAGYERHSRRFSEYHAIGCTDHFVTRIY